ncbi:MAG: hybrid sensor histidine kinase/response regulator [Steroidobacteraceae bacterium]
MDDVTLRRVEEQRITLLYGNSLAVSLTAMLMAALVAAIAWPHASAARVVGWCVAVLAMQGALQWLAWYFKHVGGASQPRLWGRRFTVIATIAGTLWGSAVFSLVTPGDTLTLSLISACLAARATVSTLTHSYHPPALYGFAVPIFGLLTLRYSLDGADSSSLLGLMWVAVLGYVLLFVNHQARVVGAQIRLRCENEELVSEFKRQNAIAEAARLKAEEASRSKSRFFAAANHDLRQPLHSLGLFASALRSSSSVDDHGRQMIDQILQCTESLEQLFDNLLDISRLDAGQVEVKPEIVHANAVFNRLRSTFTTSAKEKGLKLSVRGSRIMLNTDSTLLFRVLSNFVSNAIRYADKGGILVAARRRGMTAHIEVWDTGVGIPPEQHERIFEEFYQLANPERDRSRGLGLGLATVRRIAQLLGHSIRVRSTPGKGSRFTIEVPIADASRIQSIAATVEQKVPNLLGNKLIVVIDDEATVRLGMQSLLESWGCKCITAIDAAEALQGMNGRLPDFIIADLRLRGNDTGIEAIRTLRSQLGDGIPAVLISGDTAAEQLRRVSAAGLTMMHKPLKAVRLRALLNHEFAKRTA